MYNIYCKIVINFWYTEQSIIFGVLFTSFYFRTFKFSYRFSGTISALPINNQNSEKQDDDKEDNEFNPIRGEVNETFTVIRHVLLNLENVPDNGLHFE